MSSAWAGGGWIDFNGAVVVPTCTAGAEATALVMGDLPSSRLYACGGHLQEECIVDAAVYLRSTQRLGNAAVAGSPLLQYFVGYRTSMHAADVWMVTWTYEWTLAPGSPSGLRHTKARKASAYW